VKTDQKGTAVCHDVHRAAGEKIVQATYRGDSHFARSVSNQLIEVVHWSLRLRGRPVVRGRAVTATLRCASRSRDCHAVLALTVTKTVHGGARGHGRGTHRTVAVAVGSTAALIRAGKARRLRVRLDAHGRLLLATHPHRPVKLSISLKMGKQRMTVATRKL
jgi:hypothetical protein